MNSVPDLAGNFLFVVWLTTVISGISQSIWTMTSGDPDQRWPQLLSQIIVEVFVKVFAKKANIRC